MSFFRNHLKERKQENRGIEVRCLFLIINKSDMHACLHFSFKMIIYFDKSILIKWLTCQNIIYQNKRQIKTETNNRFIKFIIAKKWMSIMLIAKTKKQKVYQDNKKAEGHFSMIHLFW